MSTNELTSKVRELKELTEDIFDYIPPQKTNQIFIPKKVVKQMVDMLEEENPGCFDNPDKTFADLYMKSGLYITEIVKKLYNSKKMIELFPDSEERLKHIFEKQVYGLDPTEIIYRIALSFILGFTENASDIQHNFRMLDPLPYAKDRTLEKNENQRLYKSGIQTYDVWVTRGVIFKLENGREISLEKDVWFSEDIIVERGENLIEKFASTNEFIENFDGEYKAECQRYTITIV